MENPVKPCETLEDMPQLPADPDKVLTDERLAAGGLVKVNAFMRSKASANALRVKRHRDRKEAEGVKQINVQATEEAREVIKEIAKRTATGEELESVLAQIVSEAGISLPTAAPEATKTPQPKPEHLTAEEKRLVAIGHQVETLSGWRRALARIIGLTTS